MQSPRLLLAVGLWAFFGTTSCADNFAPEPCSGDVSLQASNATTPEFDWTPSCALRYLAVSDATGAVLGNVGAPVGTHRLSPPVRYGTVPPGATEEVEEASLQPGFGYTGGVFRLEEQNGELFAIMAPRRCGPLRSHRFRLRPRTTASVSTRESSVETVERASKERLPML